jgi:hypothetical protein
MMIDDVDMQADPNSFSSPSPDQLILDLEAPRYQIDFRGLSTYTVITDADKIDN